MLLGDKWTIEHPLPEPLPSPIPHIPETFTEYVDHLPAWEQDLFSQLEMSFGCYTTLELIDQYPITDPPPGEH